MSNGNQWNNRHMLADEADQQFEGRNYTRLYDDVAKGNVSLKTSRAGVECLTFAAVAAYEESTGHKLPHNLGSLSGYQHFGVFLDEGHVILEQNARFAGWLKRVAVSTACGALRRFIAKTTSVRGEGSPRTSLHLRQVAEKCYSPETANRRLVAIRTRANQILCNYGISVSNDALAAEMHCRKPVGKSAHRAAKMTLAGLLQRKFGIQVSTKGSDRNAFFVARGMADAFGQPELVRHWAGQRIKSGEFNSLREAFEARDRLVLDRTDGVEMLIDPTTMITKVGITATLGFWVTSDWRGRTCIRQSFLVRKGERSFHADSSGNSRWNGREYVPISPINAAIHQAIKAWRKQDEAKAEFSVPENCTVLVWFGDSIDVGNCEPGTRAFMSRVGIGADRRFVPVDKLMPFIGEELVKRVVARAIAAAKGQLTMTAR